MRTLHSRPTWQLRLGILACACLLPGSLPTHAHPQPQKPAQSQPASAPEQRARLALQAAQEAIEREDYETAARLLENFLFEQPGTVRALFNLAYCYSQLGRPADAIDMYRETLEVDPELVPAHLNLALLLYDDGQQEAAAEELQRVLELDPENYRAHLFTATLLEESGEKEQAREHYRRAAALDPQQAEPRRRLLALLLEQEDWAGAETVLAELLALQPQETKWLRLRGDLLVRQEKTAAALAAYEDYLTQEPQDFEIRLAVARLYRQQGKLEEALAHLRALEEQAPPNNPAASEGRQWRADILVELERWPEAIALYRQALARHPAHAALHAGLGYALLKNRQYQEAIPELVAALQLEPERVETYNHLAAALTLSGNLAGAIEVLDRRAAYAQETPGTLFLRARNYDKLNQCGRAIENYEKFLDLNAGEQNNQYFQATGRLRLLKNTCRQRRR
ncbi:MAG: tetratricopeptide repeat protein [Terriglobia bacterium]